METVTEVVTFLVLELVVEKMKASDGVVPTMIESVVAAQFVKQGGWSP